jgi:Fe-S-cluster-containing dehydrogenase component
MVPACVSTCPAGARSFGDLGDENSEIFRLVEERNGYDLMPEQECAPTNKYLPPREKNDQFSSDKLSSVTQDNDFTFETWKEIIKDASK